MAIGLEGEAPKPSVEAPGTFVFAAALRLALFARAVVGWAGTRLSLSRGGGFALGLCLCPFLPVRCWCSGCFDYFL